MAKLARKKGITSQIFHVFIQDSASTVGAGKTGLAYNTASLVCRYITSAGTLSASITLEDITTLGTYAAPTSNAHMRFKEVSNADPSKGLYEIQVHNDWMNLSGGNLIVMMAGATGMAPIMLEVDLQADSNLTHIQGDAQSVTDLKDFADAGYDPSVNKVEGLKLADAITDKADFALSAASIDAIWDEVLTAAAHNVANSAGKRLRQLSGYQVWDGTAQAGSLNTITLDAGASASDDIYKETLCVITEGTGQGGAHHIVAYNGTTKVAVVDDNWVVVPDATSVFQLFGSSGHDYLTSGKAAAGGATSITLNSTASTANDTYEDSMVVVPSGTGAGQARRCTAYNGTTKVMTVDRAWVTNPDSTSAYLVYPLPRPKSDLNLNQTLTALVGYPTTVGGSLYFSRQMEKNKLVYNKSTDVMTLYDDDGTTAKGTGHTMTDDASTATRGAS